MHRLPTATPCHFIVLAQRISVSTIYYCLRKTRDLIAPALEKSLAAAVHVYNLSDLGTTAVFPMTDVGAYISYPT